MIKQRLQKKYIHNIFISFDSFEPNWYKTNINEPKIMQKREHAQSSQHTHPFSQQTVSSSEIE